MKCESCGRETDQIVRIPICTNPSNKVDIPDTCARMYQSYPICLPCFQGGLAHLSVEAEIGGRMRKIWRLP